MSEVPLYARARSLSIDLSISLFLSLSPSLSLPPSLGFERLRGDPAFSRVSVRESPREMHSEVSEGRGSSDSSFTPHP